MLFDKRVTQMSEASEGGEHQQKSFEDRGRQQERTKVIPRGTMGPEENFVAGA